jgi:hypothetical protein
MSAINNLGGRIVVDGKVVYIEKLDLNIFFAVVEMYEPKYVKENYGISSSLLLNAFITNGVKYQHSNSIVSFLDIDYQETIDQQDEFSELKELKTSQGFRVWQHQYYIQKFNEDGKKKKARRVKWLVEVPKEELSKFFSK